MPDRDRLPGHRRLAAGRSRPRRPYRQSGAPGDPRRRRSSLSSAGAGSAGQTADLRWQPRGPRHERGGAAGSGAAAGSVAAALACRPSGAPGGPRRRRGGLPRRRHRRRSGQLFYRYSRAARARASGDLPGRCLDDRGARRLRPAGAAGALPACRRRSSDGERARLRRSGRRLGHRPGGARSRKACPVAGPALRRDGEIVGRGKTGAPLRPARCRPAPCRSGARPEAGRKPHCEKGRTRGMRTLPRTIGVVHFVGIGGIGMSGIAEVLHNLGYRVQGSDLADGANVRRLAALGIPVMIGHAAENLGAASVVVMSSAIKPDNPEIAAARARRIPVVRRAEMLAELMRLKWSLAVAGTHGKTTTTSMIGALLEQAGLDPTVINGGIINAEHLDFYGTFEALKEAFATFVANIPFYGFAVLCSDHPVVRAMVPRLSERRVVTYGLSEEADIRAVNVRLGREGARYDVVVAAAHGRRTRTIAGLALPMFGPHNVQNSLAAIAVAEELGLGEAAVRTALATFKGVKRRFTKTGEWDGVTIIDDYGHHPVEIAAVLKAARAIAEGRVIAVWQPHRFTRVAHLFDGFCACFDDAGTVLVADIYAAGEAPIAGVDRDALVAGLRRHGHRDARPLAGPDELAPLIAELARPGDIVVCLGAGSITGWANSLPQELAQLAERARVVA